MFVGRQNELETLGRLWRKDSASLVVCSGRRRIGKSTLIEEYAARSKCRFIEIVGLAPDAKMNNEKQLANFMASLPRRGGRAAQSAEDWPTAFKALSKAVPRAGRTVVFLDEISWMGGYDETFAAYLKNAWDVDFSRRDNLVFVICGSVSAWIAANILNSKGFVGRISVNLKVDELPIGLCSSFWGKSADQVATGEIVDLLSVTGGVPKYLQEVDSALSTADNIRNLCFFPEGYLFEDFDRIFTDVFSRTPHDKRKIIKLLAEGPRSAKEIADSLDYGRNGHLTAALSELKEAGFVSCDEGLNPATQKPVREVHYRIRDNYIRFYLKCIAPRAAAVKRGLFRFRSLEQLPGWESLMGFQFESLVANNLQTLTPLIGLGDVLVTSAAPYACLGRQKGSGVQIDLLLQTRKSVCVVEVKRRKRIDESVETQVQEKIARLALPREISVRKALVYEGELNPRIRENGYFDFLISADRLLGREL